MYVVNCIYLLKTYGVDGIVNAFMLLPPLKLCQRHPVFRLSVLHSVHPW